MSNFIALRVAIPSTLKGEMWGSSFNCSTSNPHTVVWTSFDTTTLTGRFLFDYAWEGIDIFGFEWDGACNASYVNLSINVPSLMLLCEVENRQTLITNSLDMLTEKVSEPFSSSDTHIGGWQIWKRLHYTLLSRSLAVQPHTLKGTQQQSIIMCCN